MVTPVCLSQPLRGGGGHPRSLQVSVTRCPSQAPCFALSYPRHPWGGGSCVLAMAPSSPKRTRAGARSPLSRQSQAGCPRACASLRGGRRQGGGELVWRGPPSLAPGLAEVKTTRGVQSTCSATHTAPNCASPALSPRGQARLDQAPCRSLSYLGPCEGVPTGSALARREAAGSAGWQGRPRATQPEQGRASACLARGLGPRRLPSGRLCWPRSAPCVPQQCAQPDRYGGPRVCRRSVAAVRRYQSRTFSLLLPVLARGRFSRCRHPTTAWPLVWAR